jgi:hypothetical protein
MEEWISEATSLWAKKGEDALNVQSPPNTVDGAKCPATPFGSVTLEGSRMMAYTPSHEPRRRSIRYGEINAPPPIIYTLLRILSGHPHWKPNGGVELLHGCPVDIGDAHRDIGD